MVTEEEEKLSAKSCRDGERAWSCKVVCKSARLNQTNAGPKGVALTPECASSSQLIASVNIRLKSVLLEAPSGAKATIMKSERLGGEKKKKARKVKK